MQNIISELIEIEQSAGKLLREADEYAAGLGARIEGAKARIKSDIADRDAAGAKAVSEKILLETDTRLKTIETMHKAKLEAVQKLYDETHESIEESIFRRVIGKPESVRIYA